MPPHDRRLLVKFSLYEYGDRLPHPRDIDKPTGAVLRAWVPQTLGDQIWIFYEFSEAADKAAFVKSPPAVYREAAIRTPNNAEWQLWVKDA